MTIKNVGDYNGMHRNTLTSKGKITEILSRCKAILFNFIDVKKKIILFKIWNNIKLPTKKEVIIITDGPSFNKKMAEKIFLYKNHFDILAMNNYFLNDCSKELIPDYYLLSDFQYVETQSVKKKEINKGLYKYILNTDIKLLLPYGKIWKVLRTPYVKFNDSQNLSSNNIDPRKPRGYRGNTSFKAIALMLAMKYSKIYIVGFDYDYPRKITLDMNNKLFLKDDHSYGEKGLPINFHCSTEFDSVAHAMHWWAQDYWHLKKLNSPKVINVTKDSMIDVFSRITPDDFIDYMENV